MPYLCGAGFCQPHQTTAFSPEHDIGPPTAVTRLPHRIIVSDFGAPSVYFFLSLTITIVTGASVAVNCPLLRIFRGLKEANQLCLARSLALSLSQTALRVTPPPFVIDPSIAEVARPVRNSESSPPHDAPIEANSPRQSTNRHHGCAYRRR